MFDLRPSASDVPPPAPSFILHPSSFILPSSVLLLCGYLTWVQVGYWRNSAAVWTRCLAVGPDNAVAHQNYGLVLEERGQLDAAMEQYRAALRLDPNFFEARNNLGCALYQLGRLPEATNELMQAVNIWPHNSIGHHNLARVLAALGDWTAAREHFEAAMARDPANPAIPTDWGKALLDHNRAQEALERFNQALQINPDYADARLGYGSALGQIGAALAAEGKPAEAAWDYREALRLQPDLPEVLNNLAWLLATARDAQVRNGEEAVRYAQRACELTHDKEVMFIGTLAAAYAEAGRFEGARATAQKAIALADAAGQAGLAARNRELLKLYEAGQPCRQ